jgi:hypothetical protein
VTACFVNFSDKQSSRYDGLLKILLFELKTIGPFDSHVKKSTVQGHKSHMRLISLYFQGISGENCIWQKFVSERICSIEYHNGTICKFISTILLAKYANESIKGF